MNRIVLDAEQQAAVTAGGNRGEFVDERGNVLGHLLSVDAYERFVAMLFPPVTDAEIAAARREMLAGGGVDGSDLVARLNRIAAGPAVSQS